MNRPLQQVLRRQCQHVAALSAQQIPRRVLPSAIRHVTTTSPRGPKSRGAKPRGEKAAQQVPKTDAENGARELLRDYRQALENLDCTAIMELYPVVKAQITMQDLRRTFNVLARFIKYNAPNPQVPSLLKFLDELFAEVTQKSKGESLFYPEPSWSNNILLPHLALRKYAAMDKYWKAISQDPELFSGMTLSLMIQSFQARLTSENTAEVRSKVDELWEMSKTHEKTLMHSAVVSSYIEFLCVTGDVGTAENVFTEYDGVQTSILAPDRSRQPYRFILRHFNKAGDLENTKKYVDIILERGCLPYAPDVTLLFSHYSSLETLEELENLVSRLLGVASQIRSTRTLEDAEGDEIRAAVATLITAKKKEHIKDFNLYQYASDWIKTMEALGIETNSVPYNLLLDAVSTMPFALSGSEVSETNTAIAEKLRETGSSPEAALRLTYIADILSRMQDEKIEPQMSTYRTLMKAYALWSIEGPRMIQMVFRDMNAFELVVKSRKRFVKERVNTRSWAFLARNLLQCDADPNAAQRRGASPNDSPSGLSILTSECQDRLSTVSSDNFVAEAFRLIMGEFDRTADSFPGFDAKPLREQFYADFMTSLDDQKRQAVQKEYELFVATGEILSNEDKTSD